MKDFEVLVVDGAYPSSVAMSCDILAAAAQFADKVGAPIPTWGVYSLQGGQVALRDGLGIETARFPRRIRGRRSICIVPGLGTADPEALMARMATPEATAVAGLLARHVACGGRVAASCSAVFLLHAAGLLGGRRATTAWWLAPTLARMAPGCVVDADRMVCADGPVVTAGAAFGHADLMLHLLRDRFGPDLAEAVSRALLLEHRHYQSPFVVPEMFAGGHALVAQLTTRVEKSLPNIPPISQLARDLCVSQRTLGRHVHKATGKTTSSLVQGIKLRRARLLLENSRMTIDQVAVAVGYQDATALRRLMRKSAGTKPTTIRRTATVGG